MLRFTPPTTRVSHKARWPDVERSQRRTPFSRRPDLESLSAATSLFMWGIVYSAFVVLRVEEGE
jgi:hypothetical protein